MSLRICLVALAAVTFTLAAAGPAAAQAPNLDDFDPADGLVHASEAYRLAADQIQGAVSVGDTWYLSRTNRREGPGELIVARPDSGPAGTLRATETRPAGIGPEDLSFTPADDRLWTVTEFAGLRMLYGVPR